ncbi:ABC-2 type transport system permease protein [Motilibacter rhizosphaerae]|uniref:ABC-2 type transport system permease protein n=1 Tax=Motilibacter rhizosphaerae TaxID=598652 RepID=A0A4Q7NQP3_9ACTN|nr:ABC transporter permease [Motilibacter rhizosphaerae]RZS86910.1 ABC-2 type transport system permease protein [Motilibacter rhizosphaerae]
MTTVLRWELRTLASLWRVRIAALLCLVGPFAFVVLLESQSQLPVDTLFGRWVKESGYALPLLVLGFVAQWAFPALTCVVAGDIFSVEDAHGTWKTLLTRSRSRGEVFTGKVLAAACWTVFLVALLAVSSTLAGVLLVGSHPLVGLSGNVLSPGSALGLDLGAWLTCLPPALGFTSLGVALSVVSRSSVVGVVAPVVLGLLMQLYAFLGRSDLLGHLLLTLDFGAWHGLAAAPVFLRPLVESLAVSAAYVVVLVSVAWWRFHDRDEVG